MIATDHRPVLLGFDTGFLNVTGGAAERWGASSVTSRGAWPQVAHVNVGQDKNFTPTNCPNTDTLTPCEGQEELAQA